MIRVAQMTLTMGQGGIENLIVSMARHQAKSVFQTSLYCLDSGGDLVEPIQLMGAPVRVFARKPGLDLGVIWRLAKSMRSDGIHVLHTHNQAAHFYGCLAARLARVPVVINTEHSRHNTDGLWRRRVEKKVLSWLSSRMVTVSDELRAASIKRDGVSVGKVEVVGNGVDIERFSSVAKAVKRATKKALGLKPGQKTVCIIARLHPIKNHTLLIQALSRIRQDHPDVHLLVIGDGELKGELEDLTRYLGLGEAVTFLGNRLDIPELMSISNLLVLCSHSEGLPLVLLEAMAAELPVLVTEGANRGGLIRSGENGLVCRAEIDALSQAIVEAFESDSLGKLARRAQEEVARRFSITQTVRRYESMYLDLLHPGRKSPDMVEGFRANG